MRKIKEVPLHLDRRLLGVYTGYVVEKFRYLPNFITHLPRFSTEGFGRLYLSAFLFWFGAMLYFTQFPVLLKGHGFGAGILYAMSVANSSISAYMYTRAGERVKNEGYRALRFGLILRVISFLLLSMATFTGGLMFALLAVVSYSLAGYTWAFIGISTTAIISRSAPPGKKGTLIGTYNLVSSLGAITGNIASGFIVSALGFTADLFPASLILAVSMIPMPREGEPCQKAYEMKKYS